MCSKVLMESKIEQVDVQSQYVYALLFHRITSRLNTPMH